MDRPQPRTVTEIWPRKTVPGYLSSDDYRTRIKHPGPAGYSFRHLAIANRR